MSQETIGPGRGPNGAKPHMAPIGINQGTAPGPVLPEYTLRQDYPNSWLNRYHVGAAAITSKDTHYTLNQNTITKFLNANPNRIAALITTDGGQVLYIARTSAATFSNATIVLPVNTPAFMMDTKRYGNIVQQDWWFNSFSGSMQVGVIEMFLEPFDPRVTKSLFP